MNETLMHYGVKGQSWGKRNYQHEDGTLTAEGKERYSKGLTRSGASVFRSDKPKIGQQVWTAKKSMTKVGDLPEETKEKLLERVRQARQGGAMDEEGSGIPGMTREVTAVKTATLSLEELEKIRAKALSESGYSNEDIAKALEKDEEEESKIPGMTRTAAEVKTGELSPEEKEKLRKKRAAAIKPVEPKKAVAMSDSTEDFLEHHGILGMKWGIRRYQNSDGSLTAAGRKRYGVDENDGQRSSSGQSSGSNSDTMTRTPAKSASEMTDQELNQALNRLRMEQQYNELTGAKSSNQYQNQQNFSTPPSNTGNLSNAELQAYITRLDMEKRYAQLTAPPPKEVSAGRKFFNEVVGPAINQVAKAYIVASLSKALGLKGDGDNGGGNNNNNGGKKNNNDDSQYKSIKKELNDLKSMMGSQRKQDGGGNQKKESFRDSGSESSNGLPEPRNTETQKPNTHRNSIFAVARDAARNAREQRREREQEREQRRQESREKRERRNAQWFAFLDGLDRQTGGSVDPVTKSYKTRAQSYFDSYLNNMGR